MITAVVETDLLTKDKTVTIKVPALDLVQIDLDPIERRQLSVPPENVADLLLDLQVLAFRQGQQLGGRDE